MRVRQQFLGTAFAEPRFLPLLADDPVLLRLLVQAGFDTVFVGIETPNEAGLTEGNKKQNKGRDLVGSVRQPLRAGLQVQGGSSSGYCKPP